MWKYLIGEVRENWPVDSVYSVRSLIRHADVMHKSCIANTLLFEYYAFLALLACHRPALLIGGGCAHACLVSESLTRIPVIDLDCRLCTPVCVLTSTLLHGHAIIVLGYNVIRHQDFDKFISNFLSRCRLLAPPCWMTRVGEGLTVCNG